MLIKNNNNHLRLKSLSSHFKKSYFLVMFRNPFSHASSLLRQHLNFLDLQSKAPFTLEFMNLIGHFEFGYGSKPFKYPTDKSNWCSDLDKKSFDYWLSQWVHTYSWLLKSGIFCKKNIFLIEYEKLCSEKYLYKKICNLVNISNHNTGLTLKSGNKLKNEYSKIKDSSLIESAKNS